jgi:hypothetical protein
MSLFDVLRYPISSPPRAEELKALPLTLFIKWINMSDWRDHYGNDVDIPYIAEWYADHWTSISESMREFQKDMRDIEALRQLIKNWDGA